MKTLAKTKIKVGIATEQAINQEFINAWKRAERDELSVAAEKLYFLDAQTLLRVLSGKRLALLHILYRQGTMSIKALSKRIGRNYRNVRHDVQLLKDAGIIQQTETKEIYVPWDKIQAEIDFNLT